MQTPNADITKQSLLIVGGGTAGWLTAAIIAARHQTPSGCGLDITLMESADIPIIGVGEGTWPTMKNTLREVGLSEVEVFRHCSATFKQGGKFAHWVRPEDEFYYHPFTVPLGYGRLDVAPYLDDVAQFAPLANFQHAVCEAGLAPRTMAEDEYQGACNYAYHVDAGALGDCLKQHCKNNLGVKHRIATVASVDKTPQGEIASLQLEDGTHAEADLFIDCTGFASLLLGKALGVAFNDVSDVLFNDTALAMQVPYLDDQHAIASNTIATGQTAGWIWDIGLTTRRGVGHVYASQYISDDEAEAQLRRYLGAAAEGLEARKIPFRSGYRDKFWQHNCVAIGLSGGFVEPLEATAIMLVEIAARYVADNVMPNKAAQQVVADRFNTQMQYRWGRIIDFLKLHYCLTQRKEPYWQAHADPSTWPETLQQDLAVWQARGPVSADFDSTIELFPAASYQYVLYGMGFRPDFAAQPHRYQHQNDANKVLQRNQQLTEQLLTHLPTHRQYIEGWLRSQPA